MKPKNGAFIISLDFELFWGILSKNKKDIDNYKNNLFGARNVIPRLLELFDKYKIHATWATVGLLFFKTKNELIAGLPEDRPAYPDKTLSPYEHINEIGEDEKEDPLHYAPSLINLIASYPNQEISSHTFSHYNTLEIGQNGKTFEADLATSIKIAKKYNINIETLVFPYHKINYDYLPICKKLGIMAYRGNQDGWLHNGKNYLAKIIIRFVDRYVNIAGHNAFLPTMVSENLPLNIKASRFLYPYSGKLRFLEKFRLNRILSGMTYAAKNGLAYHIWWHPHNFGLNQEQNLMFLEKILKHYLALEKKYNMASLNIKELAQHLYGK